MIARIIALPMISGRWDVVVLEFSPVLVLTLVATVVDIATTGDVVALVAFDPIASAIGEKQSLTENPPTSDAMFEGTLWLSGLAWQVFPFTT